jgi:hypothetical protein
MIVNLNHRSISRWKKSSFRFHLSGVIILFLSACFIPDRCQSQFTPGGSLPQTSLGGVSGKSIEMDIRDNGFVTEIPSASPKTTGSSLLFDQWLLSDLDFGPRGKASGIYIRYDILNSIFDIRLKDKIKSIDGSNVERFSLVDSVRRTHFYVNCSQFKNEKTPFIGFFEIMTEGKYQLFMKTDAVLVEGNYVQALDLGEKNNRISQNTAYYIARDKDVYKVLSSKKALVQVFPEINGLANYMKSAKINLRKSGDLKMLVTYMNNN